MIYVGIDVASSKHDVCIMNSEGEIYKDIFRIENNEKSYRYLVKNIEDAKKYFDNNKVKIGLESTGVYSSTLASYLISLKKYDLVYINPILTNMFQLSESIHYTKTDAIDCQGICAYLLQKGNKTKTFALPKDEILEIKTLYREIIKLNKQITQSKNRLTGLIHVTFPEFFQVFQKVNGEFLLNLLINYPTPNFYIGKDSSSLLSLGSTYSKSHINKDKIEKLLFLAKNTIGTYTISDSLLIIQLSESIKLLQKHKKDIINQLNVLVKKECPNILTIPGVGVNIASGIIGEIGDISNFKSPASLLAYSGLNPLVYQSGNFEAKHTRISKRGTRYLRNAIIMATRCIVRNNNELKRYFEKKLLEGKSYNCAIGHTSKKLVRVIYGMLRYDRKFNA